MAVIPFNTYSQATDILATQGEIGTYGSLATALESNPGWRVIDGAKQITNPVVTGSSKVVPITNYLKTAPELEGGLVGATEMVEVSETAGGTQVLAMSEGLATAWTVATVVTGILQGVGLGIKAYELTPQFWTGVSNALFGTEIDYEDIEGYKITSTIKEELFGTEEQNTTYLPYETVQTVLDYCANYGLFDATIEAKYGHDNYQAGTYYACNLGSIVDCVNNVFQQFAAKNPSLASNNAFLRTIGRLPLLTNLVKNSITTDNICYVNISFGYQGLTTVSIVIDVYTGTVATPYNHRVGNVGTSYGMPYITFNDVGNFSSSHHFRMQTYHYADPNMDTLTTESNQTVPVFIGYQGNNWDSRRPTEVKGTNIDREYEYELPPGAYILPDVPAIYDPNKTFAEQYPDWYARLINTNGLKLPYDDPSLYPIPWIPVTMPEYDPITQPEKYPDPATSPDPSPYPATDPQPWAQRGRMPEQIPEPYPNPNPDPGSVKNPRTGEDDPTDDNPPVDPTPTPPIVFPTIGGEANAIFTVYKPVLSELNSLAGVLWTSNFLENLMKVFTNNPMDAVISLHMLYATPHVGGRQNIKLGCYDSGVASDVVDKQYLQIDCGTVRIPEYFGDVRDYVNSSVDVYLPFVGMRHLKTQDIVGSYVTIKAGVDVFTGTILYTINIRKSSGINQVMYAFEGNCAIQLPLTGADKSRMFSVLGAAATGAAIGGPVGAGVGAFAAAMNGAMQADVQRSGNFGSNAGAMGVKKPYIVVSRNLGYDAERYSRYHGYPANKTVQLSNCVGYTRVLDCRVDGISGATDREKNMILDALKRGVVI